MRLLSRESGQAMTEMLVASAFVLVPLFLIVPIVGKYIDMQQAAVTAARYSAWEITVHGAIDMSAASSRVYGEADDQITTAATAAGTGRKLWRYHNGQNIFTSENLASYRSDFEEQNKAQQQLGASGGEIQDLTPFNATREIVSAVGTVLETVTDFINTFVGTGVFDMIDTGGTATVVASISTTATPNYQSLNADSSAALLGSVAPVFSARAQVYSKNWGVPGKVALHDKVEPLVPTAIIDKGLNSFSLAGITPQQALSVIMLSPEIDPSQLKFGHTDLDVHPRERYLDANDPAVRQYPTDTPQLCSSEQSYCRE
ncbi:MAG: hypothetical protein MJK10_04745 [Pseudomonadales bacterium]|nr:hypothetical protein [Pseudomonadales bacterium]NRA15009.1 hypothetical protein [Oceanospirillaceae bacterium]